MAYLLHQLLIRSAERHADQVAVCHENRSMTYRELETASDQLASILSQAGIEKGDRVGIYFCKSLESIVTIFGILKSGAVYVPLDPEAPVKRIAYIVGNCRMKALVTTGKNVEQLGRASFVESAVRCVVLTDGDLPADVGSLAGSRIIPWREVLQAPAGRRADVQLIEDDLAYILYTSGSTGEPKGVMISHRTSLTFVNWACETFAVRASDRVSNHAPFHFDLSIFDIFATIKAGGTVILVPEKLSVFPINLADFIERSNITIWYSVPSVLTRLVLYGKLNRYRFANLRTILFAGEVFPVKYLRQLRASVPHAEYYNLYGPTETNVCTFYKVEEIAPSRVEPLPIGKACANTEVFAVNQNNEICRAGELGELYVRGPGLMKGYWGVPEKTRAVLAPHPAYPAENVYRTGDLVQQAEDGNYLFIGRRDNQIKSRGYRIELGEIESALYDHPGVEEVAVIAIPDEQIGNVIAALVVARNGSELSKSDLAAFCAERIPKYMIPESIEFREALPKTSTGKIDKTTLLKENLEAPSD